MFWKAFRSRCQRTLAGLCSFATGYSLLPFIRVHKRFEPCAVRLVHDLEELVFPGVVLAVYERKTVRHDMCVTDRALDVPVPKQLLHVADARAVLKEVRGCGMAQGMRRDVGGVHAEAPEEFAEALAHVHARQVALVALEDPCVGAVELVTQETRKEVAGDIGDGHDAVAVELAAYDHEAAFEVDVPDLESGRLVHPEPRGINELEQGAILETLRASRVDGFEEARHLVTGERAAFPARGPWHPRAKAVRRVLWNAPRAVEAGEQEAHDAEPPVHGIGGKNGSRSPGDLPGEGGAVSHQLALAEGAHVGSAAAACPAEELAHRVPHEGSRLLRVTPGRQLFLDEVPGKLLHGIGLHGALSSVCLGCH